MKDTALSELISEFKLWGVKFQHRVTDGNHIEVRWQVSPDKQVRTTFLPSTASDWRGSLNKRAEIRRLFRADGLNLKEEIKKPKPVLQKALEVPVIEKDADQIKMLRAEIVDLTDMLLDMAGTMTALKTFIATQQGTPAPVHEVQVIPNILSGASAPIAPEMPVAAKPARKPSTRSIKAVDYLTENWNTTQALARDMGLPMPVTYMKLYYLMKNGKIDMADGGKWRKRPDRLIEDKKPETATKEKIDARNSEIARHDADHGSDRPQHCNLGPVEAKRGRGGARTLRVTHAPRI